jgi:hypothetical protein
MQTASLILGVLALALLFLPGANLVLSPMMGVAALVMGLISRKTAREKKEDATLAQAGFTTGLIALACSIALIGACAAIVKHSGYKWKEHKHFSKEVDVDFEELSEEFKEELREEIRREIAQEMERAHKDKMHHWKNQEPWSDEEWREDFEERLDEWAEWLEDMPIQKDVEEALEEEQEEETKEPPKPPPPKPAKKPAKLPDTKYPLLEDMAETPP